MSGNKRRIRIKKRTKQVQGSINISAIDVLLEEKLKPLKEKMDLHEKAVRTLLVIMKDMESSVQLAHSSNTSLRNTIEEFFSNMTAVFNNLNILKEDVGAIPTWQEALMDEDTEDILASAVEAIQQDLQNQSLNTASPLMQQDVGDDSIEAVSEDDDDYSSMRRSRGHRRNV